MSHPTEVKQCRLRLANAVGVIEQYAWIPLKFAKAGKHLDLITAAGWQGPWEVIEVFDVTLTGDRVREHQRINLPSLA